MKCLQHLRPLAFSLVMISVLFKVSLSPMAKYGLLLVIATPLRNRNLLAAPDNCRHHFSSLDKKTKHYPQKYS